MRDCAQRVHARPEQFATLHSTCIAANWLVPGPESQICCHRGAACAALTPARSLHGYRCVLPDTIASPPAAKGSPPSPQERTIEIMPTHSTLLVALALLVCSAAAQDQTGMRLDPDCPCQTGFEVNCTDSYPMLRSWELLSGNKCNETGSDGLHPKCAINKSCSLWFYVLNQYRYGEHAVRCGGPRPRATPGGPRVGSQASGAHDTPPSACARASARLPRLAPRAVAQEGASTGSATCPARPRAPPQAARPASGPLRSPATSPTTRPVATALCATIASSRATTPPPSSPAPSGTAPTPAPCAPPGPRCRAAAGSARTPAPPPSASRPTPT
jgi:hypothetical protein